MTTNAIVSYSGDILWMFPALVKVTCTLNVQHFPFDNQKCTIVFISWTYNGLELDVTYNETIDVNKNYYNPQNQEWNVTNITAVRDVKKYACCEEEYPDLTITIYISRRSLFYIFNLIFPCLIMYCSSFLGFFLPTESGEKVNLELTILLALVVFLLIIGEKLPPTPDSIPLLGQIFGVTLVMVSLALVMGVIVTNIHTRRNTTHGIPAFLRRYLRRFHCPMHRQKRNGCYAAGRTADKPSKAKIRFINKITQSVNASYDDAAQTTFNSNTVVESTTHATCLDGIAVKLPFDDGSPTTRRKSSETTSQQVEMRRQQYRRGVKCNGHLAGTSAPADCRHYSSLSADANDSCAEQQPVDFISVRRRCSHLSLPDYDDLSDGQEGENVLPTPSTPHSTADAPSCRPSHSRCRRRGRCICNNPNSWVLVARDVDRGLFWLFLCISALILGKMFYSVNRTDSEHFD